MTNKPEKLDVNILESLVKENDTMITCVCFLGGDWDLEELSPMVSLCRSYGLKVALYSGDKVSNKEVYFDTLLLDYLKIGPFVPDYGPITKSTTNQRFYKKIDNNYRDVTNIFHRRAA